MSERSVYPCTCTLLDLRIVHIMMMVSFDDDFRLQAGTARLMSDVCIDVWMGCYWMMQAIEICVRVSHRFNGKIYLTYVNHVYALNNTYVDVYYRTGLPGSSREIRNNTRYHLSMCSYY